MFYITGRIIKGVGGLYFVDCSETVYECCIRGVFRKDKVVPTVGDIVEISVLNEDEKKGYIEKIKERKNILIRPKVANINSAVVIFSINKPSINFNLLNKFLILAETQNIEKITICITKAELGEKYEIEKIKNIYKNIYDVVFTSTFEKIGLKEIKSLLDKKVTVFAGPSGVGKSSLINCIAKDANLKIGEISQKIERGKHTTRQVELVKTWEGTYIIDSPGFTSLDLNFVGKENLQLYFKEFAPFLNNCKFNNCSHIAEPNCAIKNEISKNISEERYEQYVKFFNELTERK